MFSYQKDVFLLCCLETLITKKLIHYSSMYPAFARMESGCWFVLICTRVCVCFWFGLFFCQCSAKQYSRCTIQIKYRRRVSKLFITVFHSEVHRKLISRFAMEWFPWIWSMSNRGNPCSLELRLCLLCFFHTDLSCRRGNLVIQQSLEVFYDCDVLCLEMEFWSRVRKWAATGGFNENRPWQRKAGSLKWRWL